MQLKWLIDRPLSVEQVKQATVALMKAHSILRTRFVATSRGVFQVLAPSDDPPVITSERSLEEFSADQLSQGFTPEDRHWFRIGLVESSESPSSFSHILLTIHHVLYDGWCLDSLLDDFFKALDGQVIKESPPFKKVVQYIEGRDKAEAEAFWRTYLEGWSGPHLFNSVEKIEHDCGPLSILISENMQAVAKVASKHQITVATIAKAAWALTLHSILRLDDVVFGNVVSGRDMAFPGADRYFSFWIDSFLVLWECSYPRFLVGFRSKAIFP
jgi:hypothetical protein